MERFSTAGDAQCWLCQRPLGRRSERHHPVPRSRGGRETVPVHPICHRAIHAAFSNSQLGRLPPDPQVLREAPPLTPFLRWIADKPADFHAPTFARARR